MDRREFNTLLLGGALAGAFDHAGKLRKRALAGEPADLATDAYVTQYSDLVHWWQNGCNGAKPAVSGEMSAQDHAFLEDLQQRGFEYFWQQVNPGTGLIMDRALCSGAPVVGASFQVSSIASTGFGLTAICVGAERGWISSAEAEERVRLTLDFFANHATNVHGWFYHFVISTSGERAWNCEVSSIDTALVLAGALTARQKFRHDKRIVSLATKIYNRIDFQWMLDGSPTVLSMGWLPESGFMKAKWNMYAEETMLYLLGMGSPTYPLPAASWHAWKRTWTDYAGFRFLNAAPLFAHQYSHAYVDYRDRFEPDPPYVNFFINSIAATLANRAFCMSLSDRFRDYSGDLWGITTSDSAYGYTSWGTVPDVDHIDGTLVPCAAGGSLMFTPQVCVATLHAMKERYGGGEIRHEPVWRRFGFVGAFNPLIGWVDRDVVGIDVGISLISAENARTGNVWRWFMANREPRKALAMAGLGTRGDPGERKSECCVT